MALRIVATTPDPALVTLPWHLPLEEWDGDFLVPLPVACPATSCGLSAWKTTSTPSRRPANR